MFDQPTVLLERSGVMVLAKPPGLATQAPPGMPSVESWVRGRLPPGAYLGIPHRLDRAVSGILLMATTPRAARQLSRQFERRQVTKTYLALVGTMAAAPPPSTAPVTWRDRIAKLPEVAAAAVVGAGDPAGREAVTLVRTLGEVGPDRLLLELAPLTGRMHQLRVQASARGTPIVGDTLYGGPAFDESDQDDQRRRPIALHALRIRFRDPDAPGEIVASTPLPDFWPPAAVALVPPG